MQLLFSKYIEKMLARASYEYDEAVKQWAAWIEELPGVYAQGNTVEETRATLASVLEDYVLVSVAEKKRIPHFAFAKRLHAKTY